MIRGALSARELRDISPSRREMTLQATGDNSPIRIIYGEVAVPGDIIAYGTDGTDLVVGVAWGYGEIDSVVRWYINGEESPSGVTATHYTGTTWQTADSDLTAAVAAYSDTLVLDTPQGSVGIAYSVFRVDPSSISGAPRFAAVIKGRKVDDPRPASDAHYSSVAAWVDGAAQDRSNSARTVTLGDGVELLDKRFSNSQTNEGVAVSGNLAFGSGDFCVEGRASVSDFSATGYFDLFRANYSGGTDALTLRANGDSIEVVVRDGATIDVYESSAHTLTSGSEFAFALTRSGSTLRLFIDGEQVWTDTTSATLTTATEIRTCYSESVPARLGSVRSLCVTLGQARYTTRHDARGLPFAHCRAFSANSALCWHDLATDPIFGMGADVDGIEACADFCDEIVNGFTRCEIAIALARSQGTQSYLDLLATYAELIYYWSEDGITCLPDQAVDTSSVAVETNCVAGTLVVEGVDDSDTPNKVTCRYTDIDLNAGYWPEASTSQSLSGVDEGDMLVVESALSMPGITRVEEAARKAAQRLARMVNRVRVQWITTDKGILRSKGEVIRHQMSHRGTDIYVRITDVTMIDYGRYRVSAMRYDAAHYPTEIDVPVTTGTIPVGAILPLSGSDVPSGWEPYTLANGRYIVGAGGAYSEGDTGGSATTAGFLGTTTENSSHDLFSGYATFPSQRRESGGELSPVRIPSSPTSSRHSHTFSTGTFTPDVLRREMRLIKKTGSATTSVPRAVRVFGLPTLVLQNLTRVVADANRLVMAAAVNQQAGTDAQYRNLTTGTADDSHVHSDPAFGSTTELGGQAIWHDHETGGGPHTHQLPLLVTPNPKSRNLPLWGSITEYEVIPGMIALWDGGALPADWVLCDGANGTPDMRDHFIRISPMGSELEASGDNTITVSGSTTPVGHDHKGATYLSGTVTDQFAHENTLYHKHSASASGAWVPPYYALSLIMYSP